MSYTKKTYGYCKKCGNPFYEDDAFCEECGTDLSKLKVAIEEKRNKETEDLKDKKSPVLKKKRKSNIWTYVIIIIIVAIVLFALFFDNKSDTKKNENLELKFINGKNEVSLKEEKRKSDEKGIEENTYEFEIKNTDDKNTEYSIILDDIDNKNNSIENEYIKYSISIDGKQSDVYQIEKDVEMIVLDSGVLAGNEKKEYVLSVWIDENAPEEVEKQEFNSTIEVELKEQEVSNYQAQLFQENEIITGTWHLNNHVMARGDTSLMDLFGTSLTHIGNKLVFNKDGTYELSIALAFNETGKYKVDDKGNVTLYDIKVVDGSGDHDTKVLEYIQYNDVSFLQFNISDYNKDTYIFFEKTDKGIGTSEAPIADLPSDPPADNSDNQTNNDNTSQNNNVTQNDNNYTDKTNSSGITVGKYTLQFGTYKLDNPQDYGGFNEEVILKENGKCTYTSSVKEVSSVIGTVDCTYKVEDHDWSQDPSSGSAISPSLKITYYSKGYQQNLDAWFYIGVDNQLGKEMYTLSLS